MAQMTSTRPESISLDHLLDQHISDPDGRDIGRVDDLILDSSSGTIDFAVVRFGGFLGMGGGYHLIPWPMISVDTERRAFTMDVTKEQVERAPAFGRGTVPTTDDRAYLDSVYQYWGIDRSQHHQRMAQMQYGQQSDRGDASYAQQSDRGDGSYAQQSGQGDVSYGQQGSQGEVSYGQQSAGGDLPYGQQSGQGDVSYGRNAYGPERRRGDVHGSEWSGAERRAGW